MPTIVIFRRFEVKRARLPDLAPRRSVERAVGNVVAGFQQDSVFCRTTDCRTAGCTRSLRRITWLMRSGNRRENRVHGKSICGDAAVGKRSTRPPSGF